MSSPGPVAQLAGRIAFEFSQVQHLIPTYLHIIFAALFPIYTAAHASLSRPASAGKPSKSTEKTRDDENEEDEEEDDEDSKPKMEGMSATDAVLFPLMAGLALTALYYLIQWDKELLNKIMNWYMSLAGLYGVIQFLSDGMHVFHAISFPDYYTSGSQTWHVVQKHREVRNIREETSKPTKTSPLPGMLSTLPLPKALESVIWSFRGIPHRKLTCRLRVSGTTILRSHIDAYHVTSLMGGLLVVAYFAFISKPWFLTNLMGFAFSYTALQLISPTTFGIGSLVLAGLFFYDIYMVFYTPMMVTVAKNLDIPIKLLFPRPKDPLDSKAQRQYSMLGLGDIVLPGIVMGLALRFDLYLFYLRKQKSIPKTVERDSQAVTVENVEVQKAPYISPVKNWASHLWTSSLTGKALADAAAVPSAGQFPKPYFHASLFGYVAGMIATLSAMHWSSHPQPALLYLVPGVLASLWGTALFRSELKDMWKFSEEQEDEENTKDTKPKDNLETAGGKAVQDSKEQVDPATNAVTVKKRRNKTDEQKSRNTKAVIKSDDLLSFTIRRYRHADEKPDKNASLTESRWVSTDRQVENGQPAGKRLRTA